MQICEEGTMMTGLWPIALQDIHNQTNERVPTRTEKEIGVAILSHCHSACKETVT